MWATVYEELTFLCLNIVGWTVVAASFSCWRIVSRKQKVQNRRERNKFGIQCFPAQQQIPYTILGGTYIALYSWRLFYYVEILYLQDGVLIGSAKW